VHFIWICERIEFFILMKDINSSRYVLGQTQISKSYH